MPQMFVAGKKLKAAAFSSTLMSKEDKWMWDILKKGRPVAIPIRYQNHLLRQGLIIEMNTLTTTMEEVEENGD